MAHVGAQRTQEPGHRAGGVRVGPHAARSSPFGRGSGSCESLLHDDDVACHAGGKPVRRSAHLAVAATAVEVRRRHVVLRVAQSGDRVAGAADLLLADLQQKTADPPSLLGGMDPEIGAEDSGPVLRDGDLRPDLGIAPALVVFLHPDRRGPGCPIRRPGGCGRQVSLPSSLPVEQSELLRQLAQLPLQPRCGWWSTCRTRLRYCDNLFHVFRAARKSSMKALREESVFPAR